jgi:hypothetical protein
MDTLNNLPIEKLNFESLRKEGYLYVDKTEMIYQLVHSGCYYSLLRPQRFGKSLLLSTLHAYFSGKKELFEGLAMEHLEKKWIKYPVLHLDFGLIERENIHALDSILNDELCEWEKIYGARESESTFELRFKGVIQRACKMTDQRVVILIDDYDKPILQTMDDESLQKEYRSMLMSFYSVLKSADSCIHFALLTGVTKFSQASEFSGLNNLDNISMDKPYATLCGITDEEIDTALIPYVQRLATTTHRPYDDVRKELRVRYGGYHFADKSVAVYNPFSLLNAFKKNEFRNYWFEAGASSYLAYLLKKHPYHPEKMDDVSIGAIALSSAGAQSSSPIPLIYQSGYLTIKSYNAEFKTCKLGFPNAEVEEGVMELLRKSGQD